MSVRRSGNSLIFQLLCLLFLFPCGAAAKYVPFPSPQKSTGRCAQALTGNGRGSPALAHAQWIKSEQKNVWDLLNEWLVRGEKTAERVASGPVYSHTEGRKRQSMWRPESLQLLKEFTGWSKPFGVEYDPGADQTRFTIPGDPDLVQGVTLRLFKDAGSSEPFLEKELTHEAAINDGMSWSVSLKGNYEGQWYHFRYHSFPGKTSAMGEPIPPSFHVVDPAAYLVHEDRARIYFPPEPSSQSRQARHSGPDSRGSVEGSHVPGTTLEIDVKYLSPPDTAPDQWSTFDMLASAATQDLTRDFSRIEIMPLTTAERMVLFADSKAGIEDRKIAYSDYWGYMPRHLMAIAAEMGGPEAALTALAKLQDQGQKVLKDIVVNQTANKMGDDPHLNLWHFGLKDIYRRDRGELTGVGNVTNLELDKPYAKFVFQTVITDLMIYGFDGHRFDLFGAVPVKTAQALSELAHRLKKYLSGEPYAATYDESEWTNERNTPQGIRSWDHQGLHKIREVLAKLGSYWDILAWLRGGTKDETWVRDSSQRVAILETHDRKTLARVFGGDLSMVSYATTLQLAAQGDVLMHVSQVLGLDGELDNTPIEIFHIPEANRRLRDYSLAMVRIREALIGFFGFPYLDESGNAKDHFESYAHHEEGAGSERTRAGRLHFKKPAVGHSDYELLVLFNNSGESWNIPLPPGGAWTPIADSRTQQADPTFAGIYSPTAEPFTIAPKTAVWLVRKK